MKLVLQPCGDSDARDHYVDTIENLVPTTRLLPYLTTEERQLVEQTFGEAVAVWGVTPARDQSNAKSWRKMSLGDTALMYRDGRFFFRGSIAFKTQNERLAADLWSRREDGVTWEYVFFLSDLQPIDVAIETFNRASGYKPNFVVQRFMVLDDDLSEKVLDRLDLPESYGARATDSNETSAAIAALADLSNELDVVGAVRRRKEQSLLRDILLSNAKSAQCALCGRRLPVDLLVIGHIKKRASCTPDEKRDLKNVMPVCYLGCDRLFENGYIYVDSDGHICIVKRQLESVSVGEFLDSLVGKRCISWAQDRDQFFAWHREHLPRFT